MAVWTLKLVDEQATAHVGRSLAGICIPPGIIYLHGPLGAGKTTLLRYFLVAAGNHGQVKSPTYTLVEPYYVEDRTYHHFDLYRLRDPEELEELGLRDYLGPRSLCLFEWPEKGQGYLPDPDLRLELSPLAHPDQRELTLASASSVGKHWLVMLEKLMKKS